MSSATTQMSRPTQAVGQTTSTWNTIFPPEQKTVQESSIFVKKLLAVGVSSVTYLRTLFPEWAYGDHSLDGLKLKILLEDSSCEPARVLVSWIQSCCEAIDKQYLRQLTLAIYEDPAQPNVVLETYTYKFKYTVNGEPELELTTSSAASKQQQKFDVRKPTQKLLRTVLLLTQSLQPLPRKVYLGMKLGYYDEVTPVDYEPQGFLSAAQNDFTYEFDYVNVSVGEVSTKFHNVKVRVGIDKKRFYGDERSGGETVGQEIEDANPADSMSQEGLVRRYKGNSLSQTPPVLPGTSPVAVEDNPEEKENDALKKDEERSSFGSQKRSSMVGLEFPLNRSQSQEYPAEEPLNHNVPTVTPPNKSKLTAVEAMTPYGSSQQKVPVVTPGRGTGLQPSFASTTYSNVRTPSLGHQASYSPASVVSGRSAFVTSPSVPEPGYPVRCPCGVNLDDGLMILCDQCGNWQHAVCFNVLEEDEAPPQHICELCCTHILPCTDKSLPKEKDITNTCLFRRILIFLRDFEGTLTISIIGQRLGVDISVGKRILMQLNSEKILKKKTGKGRGRTVNKECLAAYAFPAYLKRTVHLESLQWNGSNKVVSPKKITTPIKNHLEATDDDVTPDLPSLSIRAIVNDSGLGQIEMNDPFHGSQDVDVGTQLIDAKPIEDKMSNGFTEGKSVQDNGMSNTQQETMATAGTEKGDFTHTQDMLQETINNQTETQDYDKEAANTEVIEVATGKKRRKLLGRSFKIQNKCISPLRLGPFEICNSQESNSGQRRKKRKISAPY